MSRLVTDTTVGRQELEAILQPRSDIVLEHRVGDGCFELAEGPFRTYRRRVEVRTADGSDDADAPARVTQTVEFTLSVPYCGWLFLIPVKRALSRPPGDGQPWWAPPSRLSTGAASTLGTLCVVSMVFGYLNTLFNQTIAFAGDEFGAGNAAQGTAGAVVRLGGLISLLVVAVADRRGRRGVLLASAVAGCLLASSGALAPSLAWLTTSQLLARAFATALAIVIAILAVEEMPAGSRAYAVSVLAMAAGLGAGMCLWALPLADLGTRGWRLLYALPLVALAVLGSVGRHLPESRRFTTASARASRQRNEAGPGGQARGGRRIARGRVGRRLLLLAISGALLNLFVAPNAQFHNQFLLDERGFSGSGIGLLSLTVGTLAGIGVVVGGRLADTHGRRGVAAVALLGGALFTAAFYFADGWGLWAWGLAGSLVFNASIPALGVYGPELFPTALRGRANGLVAITALGGSAVGLVLAGHLADGFGRIGPAMAVLTVGPALVAILVIVFYPETAGQELEELNPEDRE